jgi:three-Cys-motif partner protein
MVAKPYDWAQGAVLDDHSRRKHKILREYFRQYIATRCQLPQQTKFRLVVVDGFAGAGRYACGSPGSPIIIIEELRSTLAALNIRRAAEGLAKLEIQCLLLFNDADQAALETLRSNCAPLMAAIKDEAPNLHLEVRFLNEEFETSYPEIKSLISQGRFRNVLFNLDQCGHSQISHDTVRDIMQLTGSAEIFYTFAIQALITFLHRRDPKRLAARVQRLGISSEELSSFDRLMNNSTWLGEAERMVFETFRTCAPYVSPFSIHNPDGWRYWLIHLANNYRARQVYNNVLHDNATSQAHFGRSGLNMLSYNPSQDGALYLFDMSGRDAAKVQLIEDIPRMLSESGDALNVGEFYESIYNATPAHTDDVHTAIIQCEDLEVLTTAGGLRRRPNTIEIGDTIRLKAQRSFFPMFTLPEKKDD